MNRVSFVLTPALRTVILDLAAQPEICSVSCPFSDFELWKGLLLEQVQRSKAKGLKPQEAFYLSGPGCGVPGLTGFPLVGDEEMLPPEPDPRTGGYQPDMWGGDIHVPYEGACWGDLFILPQWHNMLVMTGPDARFPKSCNYLLTIRDFGDVRGSTRTSVAGCWLYKSTAPYRDCSPLTEARAVALKYGWPLP